MSLTAATLIPGLLLVALGGGLASGSRSVATSLKRLPRSMRAAGIFFTAGAAWFLYRIWNLPSADFGDYRNLLLVFFAVLAVLSFVCVPDFLAVRGLAVLALMAATPLLDAGYMNYDHPQIYLYKIPVFLAVFAAIWLGAQPWRLRDFFDWVFHPGNRARVVGGAMFGYGILLVGVAFSY
jgi:hypothetical protein